MHKQELIEEFERVRRMVFPPRFQAADSIPVLYFSLILFP